MLMSLVVVMQAKCMSMYHPGVGVRGRKPVADLLHMNVISRNFFDLPCYCCILLYMTRSAFRLPDLNYLMVMYIHVAFSIRWCVSETVLYIKRNILLVNSIIHKQ